MERLRVILVSDDRFASMSLSAMLQNLGHVVIACLHGVAEAIGKAQMLVPDLILLDVKINEQGNIQGVASILEQRALPIVLVTSDIEPELVDQADSLGVSSYLLKPASQTGIQCALVIARSRFRQLRLLQQEITVLKITIRSRKLIEQAKGLLMERDGITEAEAFRKIQCMSRNQNIPMAALSEAIIMTDKLTARTKHRSREPRGAVHDQLRD
jgi:response regulator NasT